MIGGRRVDKPLVLYGMGKLGRLAVEVFQRSSIPIADWFDEKSLFHIFPKDTCLVAVCIASEPYAPIADKLKADGFTDIVSVYDIFEAYPECGITSGWSYTWDELSIEEEDNCDTVSARFCDKESRVHYRAFMGWRNRDVRFEDDTIKYDPTNRWYIPEVEAAYQSGFCYEEDPGSTLQDIETRKQSFPQFLRTITGHPFSYIQLHLEGRELENITLNMPYFQKVRPIIAVTVYHTRDGLWKIEKTLMDSLENYRWYFRLHAYQGQAAIMYGVPEERYVA